MDVKIALVYGDENYWVDRQILKLDGETPFTHVAFLVSDPSLPEVMWHDIHFRWIVSDWRVFPAKNYAWDYSAWAFKDLTREKALGITQWLLSQKRRHVNYAFLQCAYHWAAWTVGKDLDFNPFDAPDSYQCFESIMRASMSVGYEFPGDPGFALGKTVVNSGNFEMVQERVKAGSLPL